MSIEANLQSIADSLKLIADHLTKASVDALAPNVYTPAPTPPTTEVGNVIPAPTPAAPEQVTLPLVNASSEPVAASPSSCPITTQAELVKYVMESYKALGPVKGNMIQGVLASVGSVNINGVSPDKYATIYSGIEALKVA